MRMGRLIPHTRREIAEDLTGAHALLVRAGYIRQVSAGVFILTHLGWRVWQKLRAIIFEEMENDGVLNMELPILQPAELWEQTGRWEKYCKSGTMFQTSSSSGQRFGLAPTAEEVVTWLAAAEVSSWRDLGDEGLHIHQIGWKFRDEVRPRFGLLRGRQFDMSDAYSFDMDEEGMRRSFGMYREMYWRIFRRVGLHRLISVQADSGAIGGSGSSEFMALSEAVGEDTLITCSDCDYGANVERATSRWPPELCDAELRTRRDEHTPGTKSVEELEALFAEEGVTARQMVKTLILTCNAETEPFEVAVCIRGDLDVNLVKVRNALGVDSVVASAASVVEEVTGAEVGFAGPLGLTNVRCILFDESTGEMTNFLCGLNRTDFHALDVNFDVDLERPTEFHDLHTAVEGHRCPVCDSGTLRESKGVEVGHIFMLQRGYAEKMGATYTDEAGEEQVIWMGCYGIGVTRLIQAIADQNHDEQGLIWPESVAPFAVHVMPANPRDEVQVALAEEIYRGLRARRVEVLLDDTNRSFGVKAKDADLIGCPWRVIVGRKASERMVEVKIRATGETHEGSADEVIEHLARPMSLMAFTALQREMGQGPFAPKGEED